MLIFGANYVRNQRKELKIANKRKSNQQKLNTFDRRVGSVRVPRQ